VKNVAKGKRRFSCQIALPAKTLRKHDKEKHGVSGVSQHGAQPVRQPVRYCTTRAISHAFQVLSFA
jgi:hypothetical protein